MKFLLYSQCGEGAQILKRIELEGNECQIYINDKLYSTVFDGLLTKCTNPESFIDKDTVIFFDMSGNGMIADTWKRKGHFIYGASAFADDLEHDRQFGFNAMSEAGIKTPECKEFKSFSDGVAYISTAKKRLVFKPSGSMPCKLTYVGGENPKELMSYMTFVEKHFGKDIDSFILQDFVEGIVVSSEAFVQGDLGFIEPFNHTVEVKKSMNDDLGPSTGCSGNITWPVKASKIIDAGVKKIEDLCIKHDYIGQIDLNAVVNETGIYGLEWTPRFGYDATPTLLTLLEEDIGEFISNISRKQQLSIPMLMQYAGGVRMSIPPYPAEPKEGIDSEKFSPSKGVPIQNYEKYEEDLYFYEICKEDDELVHSGGTGVIACAMGIGKDASSCLENPYEALEELTVPDKQYRTDLLDVLPAMVEEVNKYV